MAAICLRPRAWFIAALVGAAAAAVPARAADNPGQADFLQGVAAYRAGAFDAALNAFERARSLGYHDPNLDFDLGLSDYKLGRYAEAQAAFEQLRAAPGYLDIAEFHLGLVAAQLGQRDAALAHWRAAEAATVSPRLKRLIQEARDRVEGTTAAPLLELFASAGLGYDSDPVLLSNAVELPHQRGDWYGEVFGHLDRRLRSGDRSSDTLQASAYAHQYVSDTSFDQQDLQLSLRHALNLRRWRLEASGSGEASFLGGATLQDLGGLSLEATRDFAASSLGVRYDASRIAGGAGYTYLDGWRQRARLDYAQALRGGRALEYYEFESNDRRDLSQDGNFFSQSPIRHTAGVRLDQPVGASLSLDLRGRYRYSRYRDADRFLLNNTPVSQRRQERLLQADLGLRYRFGPDWDLLLQYEYSRNESNFDGFSYQRHLVLVALEWAKR